MSRQKQQKNDKLFNGNYALLPILFVMCIVPLIMYIYIYDSGLEQYPWFPSRDQEFDIFLYYKGMALIFAAVAMVAVLGYTVYKNIGKGKKKTSELGRLTQAKWMIPLMIFALLAFVSTLFSKYRNYGFNGIYEQFESIWVVLAYCIVAVYTYYFVKSKEDIDILRKGLFFVLAVLVLIGITQLTGHDIWESSFGKGLYIPSKYAEVREGLEFNFSGSGNHQVYLTFYNPNYVGVFAALILPVSTMLCAGSEGWKKKMAWGVLSIGIFLCALGSGSKAFILSLVATTVLGLIFYGRKMAKYIPIVLMYGVTMLYVSSVYMNYVNIDMFQYVKNALTSTENVYPVEDFIVEADHVTLKYNGTSLSMVCEPGGEDGLYFQAWDEAGTEIGFTIDENNVISFTDERFAGIRVNIYGGYGEYTYISEINAFGHRYGFSKDSAGYVYMNYAYRADEMIKAESAVFKDDRLFSGRGYLWSRTVPLLKKGILIGTGADSYSLAFPQNDYVARINAGYQDQLITKPHSMYLQMGVQYGVVALIAFLVMAAMYAVQTIWLCWQLNFKDKYSCLALGLLMGIAGYGIMGISNDSCVALAPLAWIILGLGFAVNQILKKDLEETNSLQ